MDVNIVIGMACVGYDIWVMVCDMICDMVVGHHRDWTRSMDLHCVITYYMQVRLAADVSKCTAEGSNNDNGSRLRT